MNLFPRTHHRLREFDYGASGAYFLTVCSFNRKPQFGVIRNGVMCLNSLGALVWAEWEKTFEKRPEFSPGSFIVMPDHWHGIVNIQRRDYRHDPSRIEAFRSPKKNTLAAMVRGMKSAITSRARDEMDWQGDFWQPRYHEHVIRNWQEYERIDRYIRNNPAQRHGLIMPEVTRSIGG